jgi:hypothetical protein
VIRGPALTSTASTPLLSRSQAAGIRARPNTACSGTRGRHDFYHSSNSRGPLAPEACPLGQQPMIEQARVISETLGFRTPAMLRGVAGLSEDQLRWQPPNGANSAAWLLWHIAEVEDNWPREKVFDQPRRFPFGVSVRDSRPAEFPSKCSLVDYFHEVRALSRDRLEATSPEQFDNPVEDDSWGPIDVRRVWIGVATSGAWHGGQLVLLANRIIPR